MAERHLKAAMEKRYKAMKKRRIAAIRKLAGGSSEDKAFGNTFLASYREALAAK